MQRLDEAVSGCQGDLGFDPVTKPVDLRTLIIDLGLLKIDLLIGERNEVTVCDLRQLTYAFRTVVTNASLLSPVRRAGTTWIRPWEMARR